MKFNRPDQAKNACMLFGQLDDDGYDWWWHSFTGKSERTGEKRAFFIDFFLCNPDLGGDLPILGQSPENRQKGRRPSYLMVKAGAWGKGAVQLHRFFGWNSISVKKGAPFEVSADDCYASETLLCGSVSVDRETAARPEYMCGSGSMSWKLKVDKKVAFNVGYGTSAPLRGADAFDMYWHAEGMKTEYSGEVIFNGERYIISPESCYGYADKNWGSDFTSPWLWLSSNDLVSLISGKRLKNSVFDIGGGRPVVCGIPLENKLLSAFYYEGREFEFNFSKPQSFTHTKFKCAETEDRVLWRVVQVSLDGKLDCRIQCRKSEMLLVNYEAPDGSRRHDRLWNGGTGRGRIKLYARDRYGKLYLLDDMRVGSAGCEYGEYSGGAEPLPAF